MVNETSQSRYHCSSKPPPQLSKIVKRLDRAARRSGGKFANNESVRGIVSNLHADYSERGSADDLVRFFKNTGMFLRHDGDYYFDRDQAGVVLQAAKQGSEPELPANDVEARLERIKSHYKRERADSNETSPPVPDPVTEELTFTAWVVDDVKLLNDDEIQHGLKKIKDIIRRAETTRLHLVKESKDRLERSELTASIETLEAQRKKLDDELAKKREALSKLD